MSYKVKLQIFEGPLDLLLFLIKREKIDIYDIPIARITQQYLEYLELMKMLDLEIAGEFLVWAATLMHIKSRVLLPQDESGLEAEEEEDPREELVRRLLEYKKYKEAARGLENMRQRHNSIFLRKGAPDKEKIKLDDGQEYFESNLFDLITAFRKILKEVPKKTFHEVIKDKCTVSDKIHEIYHILAKESKICFLALFQNSRDKDEMITTFLAILELIKMHEILVMQKGFFDEIVIVRNSELAKSSS